MKSVPRSLTILLADDDADDVLLTEQAMEASGSRGNLRSVQDGEELSDYLWHRGAYRDPANSPRPDLILLDLNMPRKNGQQVLQEIKADASLKRIPVVVMTTSADRGDIERTYQLGASSYIIKPASFDILVETLRELEHYWGETVQLPRES